jgi:hypothetical protein
MSAEVSPNPNNPDLTANGGLSQEGEPNPLEQSNLPALPAVESAQAAPAPTLREILESASLDAVKEIFVNKLMQNVDELLTQNTEASIEKATQLIRAISPLNQAEGGEAFADIAQPKRKIYSDMRIQECETIDGRVNGRAYDGNRYVPLLNGKLIYEIDGKEILECSLIHNVDYKLNGMVLLQNGEKRSRYPVIAGEVIYKIEDKEISDCKYVRNVEGKLNGCVSLNDGYYPVLDGQLITHLEGRKIKNFEDFHNVGGKLNGRAALEGNGSNYLPVLDGKIITHVSDEKIRDCSGIKNVNGRVNGQMSFERYGWESYPVENGYLKPKPRD